MEYVEFALELALVAVFALFTSVYVAREPGWSFARAAVLLLSALAWFVAAFLVFSLMIGLGTENT